MTSKLILRIEENGKVTRDIEAVFTNPDKTRECYNDAKIAIHMCEGPGSTDDIIFMDHNRMKLEEDLQDLLNKMKIGVDACDLNILDISNNIIKDLTIFDERKKVGKISTNNEKIGDMTNKFKGLRDKFYVRCQCKKKYSDK